MPGTPRRTVVGGVFARGPCTHEFSRSVEHPSRLLRPFQHMGKTPPAREYPLLQNETQSQTQTMSVHRQNVVYLCVYYMHMCVRNQVRHAITASMAVLYLQCINLGGRTTVHTHDINEQHAQYLPGTCVGALQQEVFALRPCVVVQVFAPNLLQARGGKCLSDTAPESMHGIKSTPMFPQEKWQNNHHRDCCGLDGKSGSLGHDI